MIFGTFCNSGTVCLSFTASKYSAPGTTKILPESNMSLGCSDYIIFSRKMVLTLENFVLLRSAANHNNNVRVRVTN